MNKNNTYNDEITPLEWMKKLKVSFSFGNNRNNFDHIIKPFIQARPLNICMKTDINNDYHQNLLFCCSKKNKLYLPQTTLINNVSYVLSYQNISKNIKSDLNNVNIISKNQFNVVI